MRRRVVPRALAMLACVTLPLAGACGKKGPPLAPLARVPVAPAQVSASRAADTVTIRFTVPGANVSGIRPADIERVDVYAWTGPDAPAARVFKVAKVVASVPVRTPPPAPDPDADGNVAAAAAAGRSGRRSGRGDRAARDACRRRVPARRRVRSPEEGACTRWRAEGDAARCDARAASAQPALHRRRREPRRAPRAARASCRRAALDAPVAASGCHGKAPAVRHPADVDGAANPAPPRPRQRPARQGPCCCARAQGCGTEGPGPRRRRSPGRTGRQSRRRMTRRSATDAGTSGRRCAAARTGR